MPSEDRDRQLERALARHLRRVDSAAACPDAETLAAYHERTLSLDELAQCKEHIAACPRCQETLALVEQSAAIAIHDEENHHALELVAAASSRSHAGESSAPVVAAAAPEKQLASPVILKPRRAALRWAAPVGAIAAVVLFWVATREHKMQLAEKSQQVQVAENRPAASPAPAELDSLRKLDRDEQVVPKSAVAQPQARQDRAFESPKAPTASSGPAAVDGSLSANLNDKTAAKREQASRSELSEKEVVPAESSSNDISAYADAGKDAKSPSPPAPALRKSAAPPVVGGPGMLNQQMTQQSNENQAANAALDKQKRAVGQMAATQSVEVTNQASAVAGGAALLSDRALISVPGESAAWRVGLAGSIEHTTDAGAHWKPQKSGVTSDLFAGSAPSAKICWIAGKNGTLLLTTDGGKHWKQLTTPFTEDLGGVHAIDAQHAAIWSATNHKSFETTNAGQTWTPTANE